MTTLRKLETFDVSQNDADLQASPPQVNLGPASQNAIIGVDSLGNFWANGVKVSVGAIAWSSLTNATAALTLANAGNATTFNQTSPVTWTWANTTLATALASQSSPILALSGQYWNGSASATDSWTLQNVVANGTNGASTLVIGHTGSSSFTGVQVPAVNLTSTGAGFNNAAIQFGGSVNSPFIYSDDSTFIAINDGNGIALQVNGSSNQCIISKQLVAGSTTFPVTIGGTSGIGGISIQGPGIENLGLLWAASTKTLSLLNAVGVATSTWATDSGIVLDAPKLKVDGTITSYNGTATTGAGVPSEVGIAASGTASAAIAATNLLAAPVAGTLYRISAYLKITVVTAAPIAGPITLTYKDNDGTAQSVVMALNNASGAVATQTGSTTTTPVFGDAHVYCGSGTAIQYAIAFSGTGTYEYVLKCEAL